MSRAVLKDCGQQVKGDDSAFLLHSHGEFSPTWSAPGREPYQVGSVQLWSPQLKKDKDIVKQNLRRAAKTSRELQHLPCEDRLSCSAQR